MRVLKTVQGRSYPLPLFLPVYQVHNPIVPITEWSHEPKIDGCIINSFFLYKQRDIRRSFDEGLKLCDYIPFDGLIVTDSGAFQGFTRPCYLKNKTIIQFQDRIGADIIAPLDLVTPPGDNRTVAGKKLKSTLKRIEEGYRITENSILAGVQQGGRFFDLRQQATERLMEIGVKLIAIGSLVPFFNRNHKMDFVGRIMKEMRAIAGDEIPVHIYGAGDPVELPFMAALGGDIFDSSSYAQYARGSWYMTPYGAVKSPDPLAGGEFVCPCPVCEAAGEIAQVFATLPDLAKHNLWTICNTIVTIREAQEQGTMNELLSGILDVHSRWFPDSLLAETWNQIHD